MTPLELALTRDEIRLAFAVEIQWPEITARFHTGVGDLVVEPKEWALDFHGGQYVVLKEWNPIGLWSFECDVFISEETTKTFYILEGRIPTDQSTGRGYLYISVPSMTIVRGYGGNLTVNGVSTSNVQYGWNHIKLENADRGVVCSIGARIQASEYLKGTIKNLTFSDHTNGEKNRIYDGVIISHSSPKETKLIDSLGDGATDGNLIGWDDFPWIIINKSPTFTGVGSLGEISTIKENSASSPSKVDITLTGFDDSLRGEVLRARYHGRPVTIWLAALDEDWQTEAAEVVFKGKITDSKVKVGEKNSIKITASNRFEDWDKKRADRFNDESQNARHPGDRALKYVCDTSKREITFAGKTTDFDLKA